MKGITNTLEVITLGASLTSTIASAREDGKINAEDFVKLVAVIPHVKPAFDDISEVPAELKDLDSAETELVLERVKGIVGDVGSEKAIAYAESALKIGLAVYEAIEIAKS